MCDARNSVCLHDVSLKRWAALRGILLSGGSVLRYHRDAPSPSELI